MSAGEPEAKEIEGGAPGSLSPDSAAATPITEKSLDKTAESVDTARPLPESSGGAEWVEGALGRAGELLNAIPQDAPSPVLPLFRAFRDRLIEAGGGVEYANTPDDAPPATFQAPKKKAVENTVETRVGWKASVISRFKPLMEAIPLAAGAPVFAALEELKKAVSSAKPGARDGE